MSQGINFRNTGLVHKGGSSVQYHADPVDSDDTRLMNPGTPGDIACVLMTFRNGLNGGVWREQLDPKLIAVVHLAGTSVGLVIYDRTVVGVAHIDQHGNIGSIETNEKFEQMVERHVGKVSL